MSAQGRTLKQMLQDRLSKQGLYDTPRYWDMKADVYQGLARSNWPSNTYNKHWDERQMSLLDRALGDVRGLAVADVACGTGRACRHLARGGARVTGLDFAPRTLEAARSESQLAGLGEIEFRLYDALTPTPPVLRERFDLAVTISCLAMACRDAHAFELALHNVIALVRPGGRLFFLEPIHTSRLLRRILPMSAREWIARCQVHGLSLVDRGRMGFVPARLLLAFRDWPDAWVAPLFRAGETLLDASPLTAIVADYQWLMFRKPVVARDV